MVHCGRNRFTCFASSAVGSIPRRILPRGDDGIGTITASGWETINGSSTETSPWGEKRSNSVMAVILEAQHYGARAPRIRCTGTNGATEKFAGNGELHIDGPTPEGARALCT